MRSSSPVPTRTALMRLESILEGIARYQSSVRTRAEELARSARVAATEAGRHAALSAAPVTPPEAPAAPRVPVAPPARVVPAMPAIPAEAGPNPPHGCAARRRLGPARPARLRDHRWRRHGVRHHPALRARREPRLDHTGDARRLRRLRLGGSRRRCVLGAVALRPAADVARRRRRGHRGGLRHAGRSRGPLRPRAGLARTPARGRHRGASPS